MDPSSRAMAVLGFGDELSELFGRIARLAVRDEHH
jgi:hypothetical protein